MWQPILFYQHDPYDRSGEHSSLDLVGRRSCRRVWHQRCQDHVLQRLSRRGYQSFLFWNDGWLGHVLLVLSHRVNRQLYIHVGSNLQSFRQHVFSYDRRWLRVPENPCRSNGKERRIFGFLSIRWMTARCSQLSFLSPWLWCVSESSWNDLRFYEFVVASLLRIRVFDVFQEVHRGFSRCLRRIPCSTSHLLRQGWPFERDRGSTSYGSCGPSNVLVSQRRFVDFCEVRGFDDRFADRRKQEVHERVLLHRSGSILQLLGLQAHVSEQGSTLGCCVILRQDARLLEYRMLQFYQYLFVLDQLSQRRWVRLELFLLGLVLLLQSPFLGHLW